MAEERLQKILSAAGLASRRAAERLMTEGRVTVNGRPVVQLGARADPARDEIRLDGRRVRMPAGKTYLLLNKPRGYVTTRSDPQGRPTVLDLLPPRRRFVYPVGRLDFDSEGLLLMTNDGALAARLTHPRHAVERRYEVRVRGVPDAKAMRRLAQGIVLDGRRTTPAGVRMLPATRSRPGSATASGDRAANGRLEIVLREGRSRQIRKMCEAVGHPVVRLRRIRIGPIRDARLPTGAVRPLTPREVSLLKRTTEPGPARPPVTRR